MATRVPDLIQPVDPRVAAQLVYTSYEQGTAAKNAHSEQEDSSSKTRQVTHPKQDLDVGDSIVRKTDARLNKDEAIVGLVFFGGSENRA